VNRRRFLGLAALAPLAAWREDRAQDSTTVRQLSAPSMAGRDRSAVTDYQNDPYIIGIERKLRCTCGCNLDVYTCRTTDFTCSYSPELHREVVGLHEEGKSAEDILDTFVAKYGETVLMAPAREGFNWAGYLLPGTAIATTGSVIGWALMRRHRVVAAQATPATSDGLSEADRGRLADELHRLDS